MVGPEEDGGLAVSSVPLWRRKRQPTPVFLPGESQGQRSLVGCRLWGLTESDATEAAWRQQCSIAYAYHIFFIHSSVSGHLGCFHVLAIANSAALSIGGMCLFFYYSFVQIDAQEWDCRIIWQLCFEFFEKPPHCSP